MQVATDIEYGSLAFLLREDVTTDKYTGELAVQAIAVTHTIYTALGGGIVHAVRVYTEDYNATPPYELGL